MFFQVPLYWTLRALAGYCMYDIRMRRSGFSSVYQNVRSTGVAPRGSLSAKQVAVAAEIAAKWYPRTSLCLQRSVVLAKLLRAAGLPAVMLLGVQPFPFYAHAWVELDNEVINDVSQVRERYQILDRL